MSADVMEVLVNEDKTTKLTIQGREFHIGKLKAMTYLKFAQFIAKMIKKHNDKVKQLKLSDTEAKDLLNFVLLLDKEDLTEFISLMLNCDDQQLCSNVDGEELVDLISCVCAHNDFGALSKKVQGVVGLLLPIKTITSS